jgi:N-acetylglutamate synthase-like GNAT family acetyltransferase
MEITLQDAQPRHRAALETLLTTLKLPVEDLPAELTNFALAFDGGQVVGSAGVEPLGPYGLLRSVAVAEPYRNLGLAERLYTAAIDHARRSGIREVWLITNTADRYFERHGFERIDRDRAPAEIAQTAQFAGLCPSSAVIMRKTI